MAAIAPEDGTRVGDEGDVVTGSDGTGSSSDAPTAAGADRTASSADRTANSGGPPWWHPTAPVHRVGKIYRKAEKTLAKQPLARATLAWPRTMKFAAESITNDPPPGVPKSRLTPTLLGQVIIDETIMALAVGPKRFPRRADYHRVGDELARAHELFEARGWLQNPKTYHQDPPPLVEPAISRGWALGQRYERLWWPSGYEPHLGMPGTDRWLAYEANRTASAWVLRHTDKPRPWVVCIHGFGTGPVFMDLFTFRAPYLHEKLGVNIATIVLPVHGSRRPGAINGEPFLGFEFMNSVHAITQSLWDVRRLISWVRTQDPVGVGVFGISLGGMITGMVAGFEEDLQMIMAGIPVADFPGLIEHHAPTNLQMRSIEHNILDGTAQDVHRVVSPLEIEPVTPRRARAMFIGLGDRLATTDQARRLWEHWDRPETLWFQGNHIGYLWSDSVWRFVTSVMGERHMIG